MAKPADNRHRGTASIRGFNAGTAGTAACTSRSCTPTTTKFSSDAPPQAANAGFTTVLFNDNFAQRFSIAADLALGGNVRDLEWLPSPTDSQDTTSISTFPLDDVSPHFAFRHGYVEIVARETPFVTGAWPSILLWSDESVLASQLPPNFTPYLPSVEMDILEFYGPSSLHPQGGNDGALKERYSTGVAGGYTSEDYPPAVDVTKPHAYGWLWTGGPQWQGGEVCQYVDNVLQGCRPTSAASEAQQMFLVLGMGVGCNYVVADRSCIHGLSALICWSLGLRCLVSRCLVSRCLVSRCVYPACESRP